MKAIEVASALEEIAPVTLQESWDNSGFIIGNPSKEVNSAILGLDCTPEIIEEAIETGADMIITHHPLIFKGIKSITGKTILDRMLVKLIKNDIIVYSAHTNIDKVIGGVSGAMADKLDLTNRQILLKSEIGDTGFGIIGNLKEAITCQEFISLVKETFNLKLIRTSKLLPGKISKVAVCGGSGASMIEAATSQGAQIYISGDISYHYFLCENDFMIMDIGHFESEIGVLDTITSILRKKIPTFAVRKSKNIYNPIYYY